MINQGEELEEFLQEVTIMRTLNHPKYSSNQTKMQRISSLIFFFPPRSIVQMLAAWKKPKELAIAMELCEGGSAQELYTR